MFFIIFVLKVDEFHSYVKPVLNPKLSEFCTQLTGITQVCNYRYMYMYMYIMAGAAAIVLLLTQDM